MPVYSRVGKPLPRVAAAEGQAFRELSGQTTAAIAGNGSGEVMIPAGDNGTRFGQCWIRLDEGVGENGETLTSPPVPAIASRDFYPADGMPIRVSIDPVSGQWRIEGNDIAQAAAGGLNTNGLNSQNPANHQIFFRDIRNMRSFPPTTNTTSTTKITVEPYLYIYNGTVKLAQKGLTDNVDLASYIPGANLERLVGTAIKASDNSVQIVSGSTRTISSDKWTISDFQELYDLLDDDAMPVDIYRLHNNQTEVRISDRLFDWRQIINVPGQNASAVTDKIMTDANGSIMVDANGNVMIES